tara:strand:- start:2266 stop:3237 length:972 start_codon:yes stop_codon:yes gene_type:complete
MTEIATADLIPFSQSQREWDFDYNEVINQVDPQKKGTPAEHKYFFELCKAQGYNPLTQEVYFIKYGNTKATIVTNVDTIVGRANTFPDYDGYEVGWFIGTENDPKKTDMPFGKLLGAWCIVGSKNKSKPTKAEVRFDAYNTGQSRWKIDPFGMIAKCAITAAHRKAYPKAFKGIYEWSEMDQAKDGKAKNVTPPKPAPKPLDPPPAKAKTPKKEEPVVEAIADSVEGLEKIEKAIDDGAIAQFTWTVDQVGQDVSQLMNPEGNPDADAVFDAESYERIKQYKNDNFNAWKEQLSQEDFDQVVGLFKKLRAEFPEEIVNASQPS